MNRDERSSSNDPTAEPTARQSTQSASGLSPGREKRRPERNTEEDTVNRSQANTTPRRYEQPLDEEDQVMPADDSTLNTKI